MRLILALFVVMLLAPQPVAGKTQTCSSYKNITGTTTTTCNHPRVTCRSYTFNTGTTKTECRR